MLNIIRQLKQHYLQSIDRNTQNPAEQRMLRNTLSALRLAEASLLKLELIKEYPAHLRHIAIIGPTQSGKSTLLNFLCNDNLAGVSSLAGFTVHAHAYLIGTTQTSLPGIDKLFTNFRQVDADQLDPDNYQQFTLEPCTGRALKKIAPCIIWDTPDFDSVAAYGYSSAVLKSIALADVLVLVLSREKYADKSVWDLIQLIAPLDKPLLVCINKLDKGTESTIEQSFRQRFSSLQTGSSGPAIIGLPFIKGLDHSASALPSKLRGHIVSRLQELFDGVERTENQASVYQFIEQHWKPWTGPVAAGHAAGKQWSRMVDTALETAESQYKRDYLNHPERYDSFKRALAQLLILLEIPGLAQPLVKARQLITWPVRKLFSLGKNTIKREESPLSVEQNVLMHVCNNMLTSLISAIDNEENKEKEVDQWWVGLSKLLIRNRNGIAEDFAHRVNAYQEAFQQDIDQAAQDLYQNLEKQPATLNSLRAARVTADAAAVGLALKTGGIGINDFLFAPAMLAVTSLLTESALGRYIDRVKARLRVEQLETVKSQLFAGHLKPVLIELSESQELAGFSPVSERDLAKAESLLRGHCAE